MTAVVFVLQTIPATSFLIFFLAPLWSVLLVNAGLIGVAIEAATGRVSRWWLIVPLAFYGSYWVVAALDQLTLRKLAASYDAANAQVATGFDPERQALAVDDGGHVARFTQHYALPVAYSINPNLPEGYLSHRMIDGSVCTTVRENPAAGPALVRTSGIFDGDDGNNGRKMEQRFCGLSMPEKPDLPLVRVSRREEKFYEASLPVTRVTRTIAMPDGRNFEILGGTAEPLSWIPKPIVGCGLGSGVGKWNCGAGFLRNSFTPITLGSALT